MKQILEYLEVGAFNELSRFSFEEVRAVFNLNKYLVLYEQGEQFIHDGLQVKNWYIEELDKIEKYAQGEYSDKVNVGVEIPEYDTPKYKTTQVENQTKRQLIRLIIKYFNKELFQMNKSLIYQQALVKEETIETPHEMLIALNVNKNRIYSLLSLIGFYQRHYQFFLSRADFINICYDYSHQVYQINKNLGMEFRFVNIFLGSQRIKPPKKTKVDGNVDTNIDNYISEQFQSNKFIDADKISLLMLIQPYLRHNTQEILKIIEIMTKNFKKYRGANAWKKTMDEVNVFIVDCDTRGIMKRFL